QQRILSEVARWTRMPVEAIALARDGCGVPCFALPLRQMALSFAAFAAAVRAGERGPSMVFAAMTEHPDRVAGSGRVCTALMRQAHGRLFAKLGAAAVYCVGVPGAELGIALKVEDGAARAVAPAILGVLRELDLISEDDYGALHSFAYAEVLDTRGGGVGQIRPAIRLQVAGA
ncbi:MAG: asparaginase, partial [Longimicrobiaceae bacterium]